MKKTVIALFCLSLFVVGIQVPVYATDPHDLSTSVVSVSGKTLQVQHRRWDNTLKGEQNYVIKGVCWSPAQVFPVGTYPPGAPFENDCRRRMWQMAAHDFPRIREAGFNTIRIYYHLGVSDDSEIYFDKDDSDVWDNWADWLDGMPMTGELWFDISGDDAEDFGMDVLDEAYKNGLKVIVIVDNGNANMEVAQKVVSTYKNHPAVLMWMIGNEFNYTTGTGTEAYMWRFDDFYDSVHTTEADKWDSACEAAQEIADWIKDNDSNHPVAVCLGEPSVPSYTEMEDALAYMTDVDIVGINMYRGKSFANLYEEWTGSSYVNSSKPIFFSEYGIDTWHYMTSESDEFEDQLSQKEGLRYQWDDIQRRLSSSDASDIVAGACVFEWQDEWWKVYPESQPFEHNSTPGYPVNVYGIPFPYLYPDGCMHEEWFGINAQDVGNDANITPAYLYSDFGLIGESLEGVQLWSIYTWGLPVDESGHGKFHAQADYIDSVEGSRQTFSPYLEYHYTGGTGAGNDIEEGHRCMYMEVWGQTYGAGWGIFRTSEPINLTQYAEGNIKFLMKIQKEGTPATSIGDDESKIFWLYKEIYG